MDWPTITSMAKDEKSQEKGEKDQEKSDKGGKWEKDPLSGVFAGMILILFGAVYLGRSYMPDPDLWWAWFMAGIGVVFILNALLHSLRPEWKRPVFGSVIAGIALIILGMAFVYGVEEWWPFMLVGIGVVMLIYFLRRL